MTAQSPETADIAQVIALLKEQNKLLSHIGISQARVASIAVLFLVLYLLGAAINFIF